MKYKYSILLALAFGLGEGILCSVVFTAIMGTDGIFSGIGFGIAFGCCGLMFGYGMDKKNRNK